MKKFIIILFAVAFVGGTAKLVLTYYNDNPYLIILNAAFFGAFFSLALALFAQPLRALNLASVIFVFIFAASRLKLHYFKAPMFVSDVSLLLDYSNYDTLFHYPELFGVIALSLIAFGFGIFAFRKTRRFACRAYAFWASVLLFAALAGVSANKTMQQFYISTFPAAKNTYLNLVMSAKALAYSSPSFSQSPKEFESVLALSENSPQDSFKDNKPDIFLWLTESSFDASLYRGELAQAQMYSLQEPSLALARQIRVHTFGGGTFKSEFEMLSGLNARDFGNDGTMVFYTATKNLRYSLPKMLKENGYQTIVLSPFTGGSYNSANAYKDLGFEHFIQPQDFGYPAKKWQNLWDISSADMADFVKKAAQKFDDGRPLFIYMLTMNEHGPYERAKQVSWGLDSFYDRSVALAMSDYYARQLELSKAVLGFKEWLASREREWVFAYFGDHQGNIGQKDSDVLLPFEKPLFITQFYLHASQKPAFNPIAEPMDLSLAPSSILRAAGLKMNEFFKANYAMLNRCANMQACPDLASSYKAYIYNVLKAGSK